MLPSCLSLHRVWDCHKLRLRAFGGVERQPRRSSDGKETALQPTLFRRMKPITQPEGHLSAKYVPCTRRDRFAADLIQKNEAENVTRKLGYGSWTLVPSFTCLTRINSSEEFSSVDKIDELLGGNGHERHPCSRPPFHWKGLCI